MCVCVCTHLCRHAYIINAWLHARMSYEEEDTCVSCMYARTYACMYVCVYVCLQMCMCVYVCTYVGTCVCKCVCLSADVYVCMTV